MSIIIRIVDVMFFRVFRIFIIFVVLVSLLNRIYRSRQFEHASNTCRIVMILWSYEHVFEITSNTQRSFRNRLKFIFSMRSCVNRALCDLRFSLCNSMCFDVIFDVNRRKCSSFVSLLHRDSYLFLILMRINIVITIIFRRVSINIDSSQTFFATMSTSSFITNFLRVFFRKIYIYETLTRLRLASILSLSSRIYSQLRVS